jgi:Flp pilus assembly protein TadD
MLYEQLTGLRPFTGISIDEVVMRIAEGKPKKPSAVNPAVPMLLESVCLRALAHNPDNRFQSLEDFIAAIETVGGEAEVATDAQVGEYVSMLFPEQKDGRRQTLRRARELDPSTPGVFPTPVQGLAPSRPNAPTPPLGSAHLEPPAAQAPAPAAAVVPPSGQLPAAQGRSPLVPALVALLVLGGGALAWFTLKGPGLSPDAALQAAGAEAEPAAKARLFLGVARNPASTDAQREQAGAGLLGVKAFDDALLASEDWLKLAPKSKAAALLEARAAIGLRKGKRAETALEKVSALDPADSEPDALLAGLRETQGDAAGALEAWTRAARKKPSAVEYAERQGYWLSQAGQLDEAAAVLQGALAKRYAPEAAAELGFVRFRQNQREEALSLLRKATKKAPQLFVAQYYLGAVLYQQGDVKGARAAYLAADALAGDDPRALVALCEVDAHQQASELSDTKAKLTARFGDKAAALIARCAP